MKRERKKKAINLNRPILTEEERVGVDKFLNFQREKSKKNSKEFVELLNKFSNALTAVVYLFIGAVITLFSLAGILFFATTFHIGAGLYILLNICDVVIMILFIYNFMNLYSSEDKK